MYFIHFEEQTVIMALCHQIFYFVSSFIGVVLDYGPSSIIRKRKNGRFVSKSERNHYGGAKKRNPLL